MAQIVPSEIELFLEQRGASAVSVGTIGGGFCLCAAEQETTIEVVEPARWAGRARKTRGSPARDSPAGNLAGC
jgi:hypothetical protein